MRNNEKAFTLIELLAVIIILAIIALISTPIVLDVVDKAKDSSFKSSAYGILDAIRYKTMEDRINGIPLTKEYTLPTAEISVQGSQPNGTAKVDAQGKIQIAVHNNKICAMKDYNDNELEFKDYVEGECEFSGEVVLVGTAIVDKVKELVYDENGVCKNDNTIYQYMGGCYIKAAPSTTLTNHVWYNGFLWRIMGINSDGSIRMITEENITSLSYNDITGPEYATFVQFDNSNVDKWLNEYFYNKLSDENNLKTNVIVSGTFCQGASGNTSNATRQDCTNGVTLTRDVGLISIDEYNLSGGMNSYLKNGQYFWTMSPANPPCVNGVLHVGSPYQPGVVSSSGIRPVINVSPTSLITDGTGTLVDYYVLNENKNNPNSVALSTLKIGEYVNFNNKTYRVVENGSTTKLILDGYYQESLDTSYTMKYGDDNVFTASDRTITESDTEVGIGYKLNTDVLDWITFGSNQEELKSLIIPSTWYQNGYDGRGSYEISLNQTNPTRIIENVQVGLIRVGEMLSGQSYSILTNNGTTVSNFNNAKLYWTMTPDITDSNVWNLSGDGFANSDGATNTRGIRPVINVKNSILSESGNGTPNSPYVFESSESGEVVITRSPIIDKVKELVYDADGKCKTNGSTYQYMGGCYIKATPNKELQNHIWYNGFLWRIMGINEDGSIRMITEENVTSVPYNVANNTNFADSHADKWLNEYFYNKLSNENNLRNIIVTGTFCPMEVNYISSSRNDCIIGNTLTRNIGLITVDEYNLSGGERSYLKNGEVFWTMSPSSGSNQWFVYLDGDMANGASDVTSANGIRPVINVKSTAIITSGSGTLSDYYVLGENKVMTNVTGTLAKAKVGEYVSLNNKTYRVVENGSTTKLILDGYYQETIGTNYAMTYGNDNAFSVTTGIGLTLNTAVLNWITAGSNQEKLKTMILPSTWYQNKFTYGNSYEVSLNEKNPTRKIDNVKVGLIRIGEMLSGQSYSILTNNGTVVSGYGNIFVYWTMTPYTSSSNAWYVDRVGSASSYRDVTQSYGLRPVINISSTNEVVSGNGAPNTPYVIGIN